MTDLSLVLNFRQSLRACTCCDLSSQCAGPVPWSGDVGSEFAIMAEAPGATEDKEGRPLCLWETHRVLMADLTWKPLGDIQVGDLLLAPDENGALSNNGSASGHLPRRWRVTPVLSVNRSKRRVLVLETDSGDLQVTPEHLMMVTRRYGSGKGKHDWVKASSLHFKERRSSLAHTFFPWRLDTTREAGWLAGFFDGEGHLGTKPSSKAHIHIGFTQNRGPISEYGQKLLADKGFQTYLNGEARRNNIICEHIQLRGGLSETLRFLGEIRPERLFNKYQQLLLNKPPSLRTEAAPLTNKKQGTWREVVDITTTTGTFIAEGFVVHNCGDTGAILRHWLRQAGFNPNTMAMMNAVSCRPVRVPPTPTRAEMDACRPWVHGQLEVLRPQVLITLGVTAFTQIREGAKWPKLLNLHGKPMRHPLYGMVVWPSYHPSAYLRGRSKKYEKLITEDLAGLRVWWDRYQAGESWPSDCSICGGPFYNFDDWAIPMCELHSQRQGILFPEDAGVTT